MSGGLDDARSPKVDILSAGKPKPLGITEAVRALTTASKPPDTRRFEINPEGAMKASGYTPDEVAELMRHYREHMTSFARTMQELSAMMTDPDAAHYSPGSGGYQ